MFPGPLGHSLIGRALEEEKWSLDCINIRDYGIGKHKQVDDTPYGGGAGMVMKADVLAAAIDEAKNRQPNAQLIYMTPRGVPFNQQLAIELVGTRGKDRETIDMSNTSPLAPRPLTILCGRFEAIDERIIDEYQLLEVSLGDFVMTGGEIAAMAVLDTCVRLLPDVIGEADSLGEESFGMTENFACLLEYPHYTRPPNWRGLNVPNTLLSGDHKQISEWRQKQAELTTKTRRPDLWAKHRKNK